MPQSAPLFEDEVVNFEQLIATGEGTPSIEDRVELAQVLRGRSRDRARQLDRFLIEFALRQASGLAEVRERQRQLRAKIEELLGPPWHPAVFVRPLETAGGPRAVVMHAGTLRVVHLAKEVAVGTLAPGDEVFLGRELNVVVDRSPFAPRCGETAAFERRTADGRLVLKARDEEVVVAAAGSLLQADLKAGDQVRWDRAALLALERLERDPGRRYFLGEVPEVGRSHVGGQDQNLEALLSALTATLVAPEKAAHYGLRSRLSMILLYGPPGCGKTLMARVAAAEVSRLSGKRCRIMVVKPAEWESPWVGETQRNIRECFLAAREAAGEDGLAVLFLDEIEAVGRIRGSVVGHHSDKFLGALLAEIDGFAGRGGVAIIAATNRKDLVDPALIERLSDVEVPVRRPDMRGARAIFQIHLPESLPYSPNGAAAADTRAEIVETAVSRFYSPNGENELCVVKFRDGKARTVAARELASGRIFEQICRAARRAAFLRDARGGEPGLRVSDIDAAIADAMERLASTLSARNAHAYLSDLPQDVDVVAVEPMVRRVSRPMRYVSRE